MFNQTCILTPISIIFLGLINFPATSQTVQQADQDANIQGDNNQVNQVINQYYFYSPGKGAVRRKKPVTRFHNHRQSSINFNSQQRNSNQGRYRLNQGHHHTQPKK